MKYPKWVMREVEEQEKEDDIGCVDPRSLYIMSIVTLLSLGVFILLLGGLVALII